ncbi:MAG: hypothetical protein U9Q91_07540 [Candidatus Marinimicrobia bacterium]|nr:hypothetical protein [Candidatus Neomarinimicrobiota bacterium]
MITYAFNTENNIFETMFSGMIEPADIFKYMQEVNNNKELPLKLNALIDVRTADFNFEPIAIQNIVRANFRMNKAFQMINNAILANNPDDATLTMFYHYTLGSDKYHVKIFTDREKAEKWLRNW